MNCALERQLIVVSCSTHAIYWLNPLLTLSAIISGSSYECIDRISLSRAAYRRPLVFITRSASLLLCTFPCQRKIDVTEGMMFTQAATFFFTTARPIFAASLRLDAVTSTIRTLPPDLRIKWPTIPRFHSWCNQPQAVHPFAAASTVPYVDTKKIHH